jgi:hypothetical protein
MKGSSIDDPIGSRIPYSGLNRFSMSHIKLDSSGREDMMAGIIFDKVRPELPARTD